jgi:hypothetical protein
MNIFKIGRGDFFGIIVPGIYFIANLFYLFRDKIQTLKNINISNISSENVISYALLFVASYIVGFSLRLIKPDYIEILSKIYWTIFRSSQFIALSLFNGIFNKGKSSNKSSFSKIFNEYFQPFPYIQWFYESYITRQSKAYCKFFHDFKKDQYNDSFENMRGHHFLNFCKSYVYNNAQSLKEEIVYFEGVIRLLTGMAYASLFCLIAALFSAASIKILAIYIVILFTFVVKMRHTRCREAVHTFDSFAIVNGLKFTKNNIVTNTVLNSSTSDSDDDD